MMTLPRRLTYICAFFLTFFLCSSVAFADDVSDVQHGLQCFGIGCPLNYLNNGSGQSGLPPGQSSVDEDDSVGLQQMINYIFKVAPVSPSPSPVPNTSYNQPVFIPPATRPSGYYTLCNALTIPVPYAVLTGSPPAPDLTSTPSVKIDFSRAKFRALDPTVCPQIKTYTLNDPSGNPPNCMIQVTSDGSNGKEPNGQVEKDNYRVWLTGIYADGSSVNPPSGTQPGFRESRFQCILSVNSSNVTIDNGVLRNANGNVGGSKPNTNLLLLGGDNLQLSHMKIGNYNDDCNNLTYPDSTYVPNYDVQNVDQAPGQTGISHGVHDSYIGNLELVGSKLAGLEDTNTAGNHYYDIHSYGYHQSSNSTSSGGTCNTMFQQTYAFELSDHVGSCELCYADRSSTAYFHITQQSGSGADNHVIQIHGGKGIGEQDSSNNPIPKFGFKLDDSVRVDIREFDVVGPSNIYGCFTRNDSGTTVVPITPNPISVISGNVGCSYVFGGVATQNGNNCNISSLGSGSASFVMVNGYSCYVYTGTAVVSGDVFKLPPAPPGTMLPIYIQPNLATLTFEDSTGATSDIIGGPSSLPGACWIHALLGSDNDWYLSKAC